MALGLFRAGSPLHEQELALTSALPINCLYEQDIWNVVSWQRIQNGARQLNMNFTTIQNRDLRRIAKVYILLLRATKKISGTGAFQVLRALRTLDQVIPAELQAIHLNNASFHSAQQHLIEQNEPSSAAPFAQAGRLVHFGRFLNLHLGLRISFVTSLSAPSKHGKGGTQAGRDEHLIPLEVLRDLLSYASSEGLSPKDQFYFHVLLVFIATGFRLSELFTLPADCLFHQNNSVGIRYFPVKSSQLIIKPIAHAFAAAVRHAIKHIQDITKPGRVAALGTKNRAIESSSIYDWPYILKNDAATIYFVEKLLYEWTSQPANNMLNPLGVWFERDKQYIDVISMLEKAGGNHKEVARRLKTVTQAVIYLEQKHYDLLRGQLPTNSQTGEMKNMYATDSRVVSHKIIEKKVGFGIRGKRDIIRPLIQEAQRLQLSGLFYPQPEQDIQTEDKYRLRERAMIYDQDGRTLLELDQALFVVEHHTLSYGRQLVKGRCVVVAPNTFILWLYGAAKGHGTGGLLDSIFARFKITDPRTGQQACFTSHQIRHWINTMYLKGGLTNVEAALVMGHDPTVNSIYDQRDFFEREAALRQAVIEDQAFGHIPSTYKKLSKENPELAKDYLKSTIRKHSSMPHGSCTRDLKMDPCPNQLSCFLDQAQVHRGLCQYFIASQENPDIINHLISLESQQEMIMAMTQPSFPQYIHAAASRKNIAEVRIQLQNLPPPKIDRGEAIFESEVTETQSNANN
ncbi:hypothetical protein E7T06_18505 [Deinococcus sp. Arct2-2]|uniref:hypothetical protein n=1 Tax=Deinococcus sp. Arct2-2 TaxID=2568653 RepID=UPI0010A57F0F|nr:hypothetical protein [Deinococcus sp. Arct2-2]THF68029.1 hypothetical protein E7T06_18505 [Deinococcus sp. Arct2-2]